MKHWAHWSLRRTLLVVLLPGLLTVMGLEILVSWRNSLAAANAAFDRSLLGAIKAMDANLSTASGGLAVELPYRMLEFFELTANGQVFYRVATGDGLVDIGNADLPAAKLPLTDGVPQFHDADYFGIPIRVGTYARRLDRPLSQGSHADRVVIQVAETLDSREVFTRRLVWETVARDTLLLVSAMALVAVAVHAGLRPLQRLRTEVAQRDDNDLTPIDPHRVPKDVRPLVDAINLHMHRTQHVLAQRRQFLDDASHQLRTPLTTLATQVGFLSRETDPLQREAALQAIKHQVDDAIHQTNQMLTLARADAMELQQEPLDLPALAERVTRRLWPLARQHGIDLGLESLDTVPTLAWGHPALLEEALANLLHNALQYTPAGGQVTVQAGVQDGMARLGVLDNGPGMPAADRARVGQRFLRVPQSDARQGGSGLGMAIASAIAQRHGGRLLLEEAYPGAQAPGLRAVMTWPSRASA
ncbi:MAG: hypothetical protein RLZ63_984 [Pseudomonadota bacterium]|jgi:two-component system sensor histidine kinase TctE